MTASALYGSGTMPRDPRAARFLVMAAIRREWSMTREEFDRLSPAEVAWFQAFLAGLSDASRKANEG